MRKIVTLLMLVMLLSLALGAVFAQDDNMNSDEATMENVHLLSAYFGLDNSLPRLINRVCRRGAGLDGMPVIFSHPVDQGTLEPEDFAVITESGVINTPRCATLAPATDVGEMRTVLLIGEFGNADDDPPVQVEIVDEILSGSGDPGAPATPDGEAALNFMGSTVDVTPLSAGPFLVDAEIVPEADWVLDVEGQQQQGSGCPSDGLVQIVRVKWAGGVTKPGNEEVDDLEREQYQVILIDADGEEVIVTPFALADLDDGDNNHMLCLDIEGEPVSVTFAEGYLTDPNEDTLNPETTVEIKNN